MQHSSIAPRTEDHLRIDDFALVQKTRHDEVLAEFLQSRISRGLLARPTPKVFRVRSREPIQRAPCSSADLARKITESHLDEPRFAVVALICVVTKRLNGDVADLGVQIIERPFAERG